MKYAGLAPAERERQLRKLWRDTYDFITPQTVAATLDEATGDYVLSMTGSARMEWTSSGSTRWYELDRARVGWKPNVERDGTLLADAPLPSTIPTGGPTARPCACRAGARTSRSRPTTSMKRWVGSTPSTAK
jgi:hypothetical protein